MARMPATPNDRPKPNTTSALAPNPKSYHHNNQPSTTPYQRLSPTRNPPPPLPHPLKLPHKRLLHLLIPRPSLAHLLHPEHSNNRKTRRAKTGPLLANRRVGRDADFF